MKEADDLSAALRDYQPGDPKFLAEVEAHRADLEDYYAQRLVGDATLPSCV